MTCLVLDPAALRPTRLAPPASKSDAIRALAVADILGQPSPPTWGVEPDDVRTMRLGLTALGEEGQVVSCGDGAAPLRFLLALAAVRPGRWSFVGSERLAQRPHEPLLRSLAQTLGPAGFRVEHGTGWPLRMVGTGRQAPAPVFRIAGTTSSQYASALLLCSAELSLRERRTWSVEVSPGLASAGYLALTAAWLRRCGVRVVEEASRLSVSALSPARPLPPVPPDWSSIAYLLLVAWRSGGEVGPVARGHPHPDRVFLEWLSAAGLAVEGAHTVRLSGTPRSGLDVDLAGAPDLGPTLAALASVLPTPSRFVGLSNLRHKESDRVRGMLDLVAGFGGQAFLAGEALIVHPVADPRPARFDPRGDHRLAMAAATAAVLLGQRLTLEGPGCVAKSFPSFFDELKGAGCRIQPVASGEADAASLSAPG